MISRGSTVPDASASRQRTSPAVRPQAATATVTSSAVGTRSRAPIVGLAVLLRPAAGIAAPDPVQGLAPDGIRGLLGVEHLEPGEPPAQAGVGGAPLLQSLGVVFTVAAVHRRPGGVEQ